MGSLLTSIIGLRSKKCSIGAQAPTREMRPRSTARHPGKHGVQRAVIVLSRLVACSCIQAA